jgi:hypothetical protein
MAKLMLQDDYWSGHHVETLNLQKNSVFYEVCTDAETISLGARNIVHIEHKDIL